MSQETINSNESEENDRLALGARNRLQAEVVNLMFGESSREEDKVRWLIENGQKISAIIDDSLNLEIRSLAQAEHFDQAAKLVLDKLESWPKNDQQAA